MLCMHTTAAQLHHFGAPGVQWCQIKFLIAVQAASTLGLCRGEQAVGADDLVLRFIADHQVLAKVVKTIDIVACNWRLQHGTHFFGEDLIAQALGLANFVKMTSPAHLQAQCGGRCSVGGTDARRKRGKRWW